MRRNLERQGVPLEALFAVDLDTVQVVRAVGSGSPAARSLALKGLLDVAPGLPESGRRKAIRTYVANLLGGYDEADAYIDAIAPQTAGVQAKDAMLENFVLMDGQWIDVLEDEFHLTHAEEHLKKLQEMQEQIDNQEAEAMMLAEGMQMIQAHGTEHVKLIANDPTAEGDAAQLRQAFQQFNEAIHNGFIQMQKAMEEQQAQQQQDAQNGGGDNGEMDRERMKQEMDLEFKRQNHILDLQAKQAKIEADLEASALKARADIAKTMMQSRAATAAQDAKAASDIKRAFL